MSNDTHLAPVFSARRATVARQLRPNQVVLVAEPNHLHYFTGFPFLVPEEREAWLLIAPHAAQLHRASFTDFIATANDQDLVVVAGTQIKTLAQTLDTWHTQAGTTEVLLDGQSVTVAEARQLRAEVRSALTWTEVDPNWFWQSRSLKDAYELNCLSVAGQQAAQVWARFSGWLKPGVTEVELAERLESELKKSGSERVAFPTIVAFGAHAALPHHQPDDTPLETETPILVDFGATWQRYRSDMTRTVWFGQQPSPEFTTAKTAVDAAYQLGFEWLQAQISKLKTGRSQSMVGELDTVVRTSLREAGFDKAFIHTTGHGLGLDIHEPPSVYFTNHDPLRLGLVITLEPGVYFENAFGYRYENTLALTETGVVNLTADVVR